MNKSGKPEVIHVQNCSINLQNTEGKIEAVINGRRCGTKCGCSKPMSALDMLDRYVPENKR